MRHKSRQLLSQVGSGLLDTVFVLILLCVLTGVSLSLVSLGAELYQGISADMDQSYQLNTSLTYVANKVRQADVAGMVFVEEFIAYPDIVALHLVEEYEDERFVTWIYCYEGQLMELFGQEEGEFVPEDGTPLVELSNFTFEQMPGSVKLLATTSDSVTAELQLTLRSQITSDINPSILSNVLPVNPIETPELTPEPQIGGGSDG